VSKIINPNLRFLCNHLRASERNELLKDYDSAHPLNKDKAFEEYKAQCSQRGIKSGAVLEGSSRCFHPSQMVITKSGSKPISQILVGDILPTPVGLKKVIDTFDFPNSKKSVFIKLKNGHEIRCTNDHKFFFEGDWVEIKHILSLLNAKR
jgi:hypothetical protein